MSNQQDTPIPQEQPVQPVNSSLPKNLLLASGGLALLFVVGVSAYYLGFKNKTVVKNNSQIATPTLVTTASPTPSAQITHGPNEASNWKTFTSVSRGISLKYPATWTTSNDEFVSEIAFTPGEQDRTKVYNTIEIQKYPTQMYTGYTNAEWFQKINNLTASMSDQKTTRAKIASGTVASGEQYVIFSVEPSATAITDMVKQVIAYVLKGQTIYQLTLNQYDQKGLNIFLQIVPTIKVQ